MKTENAVCARQIAFFAAFVLPTYKLLELPSLLAKYAKGDLLLPATLQFLLQTLFLALLVYAASQSESPLAERLERTLGKWVYPLYAAYGLYYLFAAVLPLLDLEKFVYAAFYDTAPTVFYFAAFFLLSGYIGAKGLRSVGRSADLSLFLFVLPFLALVAMSLLEADFKALLPLFQEDFSATLTATQRSAPHFADVALLLPLVSNLRYQKGDGKKILGGYALGACFTLLFLAVFYGVFSSIALREHYAFIKIAQYFPVLATVGRIDLIFVYMLCIVLFFYVAFPLQYAAECGSKLLGERAKPCFSAIFSVAAFLFTLFCNKHYDAFYRVFGRYFSPFFLLFNGVIPVLALLLQPNRKKEKSHAK